MRQCLWVALFCAPAAVASAAPPLFLPFPCGQTKRVTQGHNGGSHTGLGAWAWDFGLGVGDAVVAAAAGRVSRLKMDSTTHCDSSACANDANYVVVDHLDGTQALYLHLQANSAQVTVGDNVAAGDALAAVGLTGWVTGAHLHFQVEQTGSSWWTQSVAVAFEDVGDPDYPAMVTSGNCGPPNPNVVVVDDADPGFTHNTGFFAVANAGGYRTSFQWTYSNGSTVESVGEWRAVLPEHGLYKVEHHIPLSNNATSTRAPFVVHHVGGDLRVTQDQSVTGGFFEELAQVKMAAGTALRVTLADDSGEPLTAAKIGFDAVRFTLLAPAGNTPAGGGCAQDNDCTGALACMGNTCGGTVGGSSSLQSNSSGNGSSATGTSRNSSSAGATTTSTSTSMAASSAAGSGSAAGTSAVSAGASSGSNSGAGTSAAGTTSFGGSSLAGSSAETPATPPEDEVAGCSSAHLPGGFPWLGWGAMTWMVLRRGRSRGGHSLPHV